MSFQDCFGFLDFRSNNPECTVLARSNFGGIARNCSVEQSLVQRLNSILLSIYFEYSEHLSPFVLTVPTNEYLLNILNIAICADCVQR